MDERMTWKLALREKSDGWVMTAMCGSYLVIGCVHEHPTAEEAELCPEARTRIQDCAGVATAPTSAVSFGIALDALRIGRKASRAAWQAEDRLYLVPTRRRSIRGLASLGQHLEGQAKEHGSYLEVKLADGTVAPWQIRQEDVLASDWEIYE
jgi:hypothetical protein